MAETIKQFKGEGVKLDLHQEQRIFNLVTLAAMLGSIEIVFTSRKNASAKITLIVH